MKQLSKGIIAILYAIIMFTAPTAKVSAASSAPVCTMSFEGYKHYEYQPEPYYLSGNSSLILFDTATSD